jgi:26S proteasome non-ATPase regulatory subunit 10
MYMFPSPSEKSASPINASDIFGLTPLHHACSEGHVDVAILLVRLGADQDRLDKDGITPLEWIADDKARENVRRAWLAVE